MRARERLLEGLPPGSIASRIYERLPQPAQRQVFSEHLQLEQVHFSQRHCSFFLVFMKSLRFMPWKTHAALVHYSQSVPESPESGGMP